MTGQREVSTRKNETRNGGRHGGVPAARNGGSPAGNGGSSTKNGGLAKGVNRAAGDAEVNPLLRGGLVRGTAAASVVEGALHGDEKIEVDGEAAEAFIREKRIGERIKYLRLKKSLGLVELGRHTGLSASFLSQLETGRVVPTLRNLARIAMVFSKDLSYFFEPEPQTLFRVHRQSDRVKLPQSGVDEPMYFFESLGYLVPDRQLDPYFAEFLPAKPGRVPRAHQHMGCEFLYVLSGRLEVRHGDSAHMLDAGDAVYFDANTVHSYVCGGDVAATVVIVTLQYPVGLHLGSSQRAQLQGDGRGRRRREI